MDKTLDFLRRLTFGINRHGKRKGVAHLIKLLSVFGIAYAGNGMKVFIDSVRSHAAQKIKLVSSSHGNQQIGVLNARFNKHILDGAIALNRHNIILIHNCFKH